MTVSLRPATSSSEAFNLASSAARSSDKRSSSPAALDDLSSCVSKHRATGCQFDVFVRALGVDFAPQATPVANLQLQLITKIAGHAACHNAQGSAQVDAGIHGAGHRLLVDGLHALHACMRGYSTCALPRHVERDTRIKMCCIHPVLLVDPPRPLRGRGAPGSSARRLPDR